ncbi:MAG: DUF4012 domain-containing protein [Candidatus Moranbacteria bacterium]|nr:DUF4012 domain-containing protein [Candidatus Moranbacteria bacterium]
MAKKRSVTFWVTFWVISIIMLVAWFVFLQVRNRNLAFLNRVVSVAPISQESQDDLHALVDMADYVLKTNGEEKVFLILFQNNMEIRPGGGFIGSFGVLKVKDGQVTDFISHDVSNFDGRIPPIVAPPYPMKETLKIDSLKFRDSNYAPDFAENARQAEYFYHLGEGQEQFDGVVAITTNVLSSFLKMTGPVTVPGYPGEYTADNAVLGLEEQVEKNFSDQGVDRGDRKAIMNPLAHEILNRVRNFSLARKYELFQVILEDLRRKDIQLAFKDEILQQRVERAHWDGKMDSLWKDDYLMAVDANLGAWKSDYYVKRSIEHTADFSSAVPHATTSITYTHTATEKSWLTKDYQTFVRFYVPKGSWLTSVSGNTTGPVFGEEFGKKYIGTLVQVKLGETKTVTIDYDLPQSITSDAYDLKIQKQPGLNDVPVGIHLIRKNGEREDRNIVLNQDFLW